MLKRLKFCIGLKFKTDFHSTMRVCIDVNWGVGGETCLLYTSDAADE